MAALSDAKFKQNYASHLKHLKLKGLQPKTIDAYSRAIRRIGRLPKARADHVESASLLHSTQSAFIC